VWYHVALLRLRLAGLKEYRRLCEDMVKHFGEAVDAPRADVIAWTCALAPNAVTDVGLPVRLAERAWAANPRSYAYARTLGAALYRAGRFDEAVRQLDRATALQKDTPVAWLLLALAHDRLGHKTEARRFLDQAGERIDRFFREKSRTAPELTAWDQLPWTERLVVQLLRREAAERIGEPKPARRP
jgi:predicted Zn-dependent protease